jgi:DNA-binding CsgD family transcriptional regulator
MLTEALRGRAAELEQLGNLLEYARAGKSGVLVLRGDPGIGKSALLKAASASAEGFAVLRAQGVESESELAFAGLQELLAPVSDQLGELPVRQRAVLAGALALGPPVPGDPLAVRAATMSLLAAVAEHQPLLVAVDDAHWLDPSSAQALTFAARRLHSDGIVMLFAMRSAEPSTFDPAGLPVHELQGVSETSARELLEEQSDRTIAPRVMDRLIGMARGNPLALLQLPTALTEAQLAGNELLPEPLAIGLGIEQAFSRRLDQLPDNTRRALVLLAAGADDPVGPLAAALRQSGLDESAFEAAERVGVVTVADGAARFAHPILRSVAYQTVSGEQRRAAHAALAAASDAVADRRAWHLASAAVGPDERAAEGLDDAAVRAAARGAPATAARAYERSARLTSEGEARCRRYLAAANQAFASGQPEWAVSLVEEGLALTADPIMRADCQHLKAALERETGSARRARTLLWLAAEEIESIDSGRAALLFADASVTDMMRGDLATAAISIGKAQHAARRSPSDSPVRPFVEQIAANCLADRGELARGDVDVPALRGKLASAEQVSPATLNASGFMWAAWYTQHREPGSAERDDELDQAIALAREQGAIGALPYLLGFSASLEYRQARWVRAAVNAGESAELAREAGQPNPLAWALVNSAQVEAAQGDEVSCRRHAHESRELARRFDIGSLEVFLSAILGLLELGIGRLAEAVVSLADCRSRAQAAELEHPNVVQYEPDLVETLMAVGRREEAYVVSEHLSERAERVDSPWGLAVAARCRGLLADESDFPGEFDQALTLHERVVNTFERGRTQLCYGERLRRARRRTDAREQLADALATFESLGATPWAERALQELRATGVTARARHDPTLTDQLTPQELRVALMVADGATIREAAGQLFLSPKTIEAHLTRVYRKLDVHNRAQLARALEPGPSGSGR